MYYNNNCWRNWHWCRRNIHPVSPSFVLKKQNLRTTSTPINWRSFLDRKLFEYGVSCLFQSMCEVWRFVLMNLQSLNITVCSKMMLLPRLICSVCAWRLVWWLPYSEARCLLVTLPWQNKDRTVVTQLSNF